MKIGLVTPAGRGSRSGNRATAERWRRLLLDLGHRVQVATDYRGAAVDLLLAIHAWRSAGAARRFSERHPHRPLVVLLSGTDVYRFLHEDPEPTLDTMRRAHALIGLHDAVAADIPPELHGRLGIVLQSAEPPPRRLPPLERRFEVCVVGHLREEKDPLRAACAVRDLPAASRLAVTHLGGAHDAVWARRAEAEAAANPRYRWWGERPRATVRRIMARARLMVISSRLEGGANVVSEACVAGLPVIASRIPGNVGLLGEDYPGYYPPGDTRALRAALLRAESDPVWLAGLRRHCLERARRFTPEAERAALAQVLDRAVERVARREPVTD